MSSDLIWRHVKVCFCVRGCLLVSVCRLLMVLGFSCGSAAFWYVLNNMLCLHIYDLLTADGTCLHMHLWFGVFFIDPCTVYCLLGKLFRTREA